MPVTGDPTSDRLIGLIERGVTLPPMPAIGTELLAVTRRNPETVDIAKVSRLIERDPALTARLLRVANSPVFEVMRKIRSVRQAITLIGLDEVLSFLNFYLLRNLLPAGNELEHFSPQRFWAHSWATATAAKMLGRPQLLVQALPGELYLAGLLHDLGQIVLSVHLPKEFTEAWKLAHERGIARAAAEREVLGVDHALLGAHLLDSWNLPAPILDAVSGHHAPGEIDPERRELAALVQYADALATECGFGESEYPEPPALSATWIQLEGKGPLAEAETQQVLKAEISDALTQRIDLLRLSGSTPEPKPEGEVEDAPQNGSPIRDAESTASTKPKSLFEQVIGAIVSLFE